MDVYAIFATVVPSRERSGWPMNLLDDEVIVQTRKTIELEFGGRDRGHARKKGGASGGGSTRVVVYEIDFGSAD